MMNKKTEEWRSASVGQPLEKEKRALLCGQRAFLWVLPPSLDGFLLR
jgi:hypothetical protein